MCASHIIIVKRKGAVKKLDVFYSPRKMSVGNPAFYGDLGRFCP